jgi:tetratricopeptide (TPR) repeat protein/putative methionine-R-sulfoxide reductase with GAF domain
MGDVISILDIDQAKAVLIFEYPLGIFVHHQPIETMSWRVFFFTLHLCGIVGTCYLHAQSMKDTVLVREYHAKAFAFANVSPDSILHYTQLGLKLALSINDLRGVAKGENMLGVYYWTIGDYAQSLRHYQNSYGVNKKIGDSRNVAVNLGNIGMILSKLGDYTGAMNHYFQAIEIAENNGYSSLLGRFYNNVGVTYRFITDFDDAMIFLNKAKARYELDGDSVNIAGAYVNMSIVMKEKGEIDEAISYQMIAYEIFESLDVARGRISTMNNLSTLYADLGEYEEAEKLSKKALELAMERGFKANEIDTKVILANLYTKMKRYSEAIKLYNEALVYCVQNENKRRIVEIYLGLGEAHAGGGLPAEAFKYYRSHISLRDSLYREEMRSSIDNARIAYEIDIKDREIQLIEAVHEVAIFRRNLIMALVIGSLLLMLLGGYLVYLRLWKNKSLLEKTVALQEAEKALFQYKLQNQQLKEMELRAELDNKNRDLASYTLNLLQKNELLSTIKKEMKNLRADNPDTMRKKAQRIISHANYSFHQDKEWDVFKQYFESAHGGLLDRLVAKYPSLGANDKKLAALMRLNLSTEQIASIMGISIPSVKVARHRLRKKLEIPVGKSIQVFLSTFDENADVKVLEGQPGVLSAFKLSLANRNSVEEAAWDVARNCMLHLKFEDCVIYFVDPTRQVLVQRAAYGLKNPSGFEILAPLEIAVGQGVCGHVALTGEPALIVDTREDPRYIEDEQFRLSELAVPIILDGSVFGVIDSEHPTEGFFTEDHLNLLSEVSVLLAERIKQLDQS